MTPIVMIDSSTNERMTGTWSKTPGSALRVLGFGGCRLQMTQVYANYKVSDGWQRLQGGEPGTVIQPIRVTTLEGSRGAAWLWCILVLNTRRRPQ